MPRLGVRRRQTFTGETYQQALRAVREFGTERIVVPQLSAGQAAFIREFFTAIDGLYSFTGASFSDGRLSLHGTWSDPEVDPAAILLSDADQTACYGFRARPIGTNTSKGVDLYSTDPSYDGQEIRLTGDHALSVALSRASKEKTVTSDRSVDVAVLVRRLNRELHFKSEELLRLILRRAALLPEAVDIEFGNTTSLKVGPSDGDREERLDRITEKLLDPEFGVARSCFKSEPAATSALLNLSDGGMVFVRFS